MARSQGKEVWFLQTRVSIRVSFEDGASGISVLEHRAPAGDSPPLHVHRNEDEIFHLIEGELEFRVGDADLLARAGDLTLVPLGVPHTYRVASAEGARWLTITASKDFERFVRALGEVPRNDGLPEAAGPPTPEQVQQLSAVAAEHGIDIVGPPLVGSAPRHT